ncbi:oligosaccharide flippase family protein [Bacillus carboniphilus]|uniref:Oligosaccharide flippase family protein n=1 Tax=Bacillus carboniphilus TaxID=86663 RepID=A0ABY9JWB7_9BACI|nr:oligosaccharide flippase family protein [Bacillus carboniphilus]WLR41930.1 oligosaccharide flippase family protein [Bacillus carboniphilus]
MRQKKRESSQKIITGAVVLTLSGIFVKILSAAYRVPFQNIVGDIGFYIYQQVYPFYGMAILLGTSAFPVIISKLIAESEKDPLHTKRDIIIVSFIFQLMVGLGIFLLLYLGAGWIAELMGDRQLEPLMKVVSISFLITPFISCIRGFYQGIGEMIPTALSQVVEQFIRVVFILAVSTYMVARGFSLYDAAAGALFAH